MQTLDAILKRLRDLPILNTEAYRLIDYCSKPEVSFETLEGMIKKNPNLSGQIFRLANSPFYKRAKAIETLNDALVLLGITTLKQIFTQNFYGSLGKILNTQFRMLNHGKECGHLSEYIARNAGMNVIDCSKVHMGGLLHDIGQLFLAFLFPSQFEQARSLAKSEKIQIFQAETKIFGITHQEVGAVICSKWNFPNYLIEIIKAHHNQGATIPQEAVPVFCANNYLRNRDNEPFQPYEKPLQDFFAARKKPFPWKSLKDEFRQYLLTSAGNP